MTYETLLYEQSPEGVATITLNRPERMNSFNHQMCLDFATIWSGMREDESVKAIVLRAAGERAWCTGVDVTEGFTRHGRGGGSPDPWSHEDPSTYIGPKSNGVWKPVICAIHGLFAGGAFYWLHESDIVICSDDAAFFDPHVTFGMVAACEPTGMLGRIPYGEIMRIVLMGNDERVSPQTALRIGLVSEITTRDQLWARAHELATTIARKPAAATAGTVRAVWEGRDAPPSRAVLNALKYTQIGNPIGTAEVDRATAPKAKWSMR
ncbi:MAG TPA: enoyl-CoA hydratase/isomerase family protein [Burkholderiales bacterium]|nr:enoyl-CoA hydratase/isomerase family protein [Burkholderiales bacterium]